MKTLADADRFSIETLGRAALELDLDLESKQMLRDLVSTKRHQATMGIGMAGPGGVGAVVCSVYLLTHHLYGLGVLFGCIALLLGAVMLGAWMEFGECTDVLNHLDFALIQPELTKDKATTSPTL